MHSALASLEKPCENTICENLIAKPCASLRRKGVFIASSTSPFPGSARARRSPAFSAGHPQRLQTLHHHYPQTHSKNPLPLLQICLPQMLHYVCQPAYDEIQSQLHSCFKCIGLCVIYLT